MPVISVIRITAKRDGFRRCGIAHSATAKTWPADKFTEGQLGALKAEPMLVVEQIEAGEGALAQTPPPGSMTVAELKDLLDKLGVTYPSDAKKAELVALVEKHTGEPPEE